MTTATAGTSRKGMINSILLYRNYNKTNERDSVHVQSIVITNEITIEVNHPNLQVKLQLQLQM
jgi:acetamidase/formamidase